MKLVNSGKIRNLYKVDDERLMMVVSDGISAHDHIMPQKINGKGIMLNKMSKFWMDYLSDLVPNHICNVDEKDYPYDFQRPPYLERSLLVKKLDMLPVECIVRGYLCGSAWEEYRTLGTVGYEPYPEGYKEFEKLKRPIFTCSIKSINGQHDKNISFKELITMFGSDTANNLKELSLTLYKKSYDYALTKGIIIADTKFEFGYDDNKVLNLADEVLTPDSSRFWLIKNYENGFYKESLDKQYLRNWLRDNGYRDSVPEEVPDQVMDKTRALYIECYEKLTGYVFVDKGKV
jgi:phosphoribosylaminoimidazole-succinocarboxamide synthase